MKFRVASVQLNSVLGEIEVNKRKIISLLAQLPKSLEVDMIVLPEMALTGYNFGSREGISSYLDRADSPRVVDFARGLSREWGCFTVVGVAELASSNANPTTCASAPTPIYNSCKLISPSGSLLHTHHKAFLYETDEVWGCSEGPGFSAVDVILDKSYYTSPTSDPSPGLPTARMQFGICMDLNPYKFEAPFNAFEFSLACYRQHAQLVVCPMAWLSPHSPSLDFASTRNRASRQVALQNAKVLPVIDVQESDSTDSIFAPPDQYVPRLADMSTVDYHILRFFPFMGHPHNSLPPRRTAVVTCNRVGVETDVMYGGSSSMFSFTGNNVGDATGHTNPSVRFYGALPMGVEGILYRELDIDVDKT
ncbi:hypothetical protein CANTEDRAFT_128388 [Yamadazyma tenuis ATCC 10573]|uniref:CN hydrolase domain-containing protein n=1 Tax=Candida tenuis (strain ATCC 10573 / BCRC 21748 / CBS 615 / JCM 9827 / NBRC 10315 / NRRL Y-1498 / VKM Y-70) TaxID=590646 RepID=G3BC38_CANTC|nr:uncharacterized protein CANTEDRAFT_128388 [Yamadazyma tenuis ATCC 10573]EGV60775.1 hypothetical protein CANTEDRAFT_128388 [Yamadazyma tenuis ATCC 10573]